MNAVLPTELRTTKTSALQNSLGASGLIAGFAGLIMALSFYNNRKSPNSKKISRDEALNLALNTIADFTSETPKLEHESLKGNSWHFTISNYNVIVNNRRGITNVRRLQKNE